MSGAVVFVDETGARGRRVGRWLKVAGLLPLLYVLLFFASLVRAPWVPRLTLPGLGAVVPPASVQPPSLGPTQIATPFPVEELTTTPPGGGISDTRSGDGTTTPSSVAGGPVSSSPASTVTSTVPSTTVTPSSTTPSTTHGNSGSDGQSSNAPGATNPHRP